MIEDSFLFNKNCINSMVYILSEDETKDFSLKKIKGNNNLNP